MPHFLFGQGPGGGIQPPSFPPFEKREEQNEATRAVAIYVFNEVINKGFEEILAAAGLSPFFATEIGSRMLEPTPIGQGEEAAIALQQQRARDAEAGRRQLPPRPQLDVSRADP